MGKKMREGFESDELYVLQHILGDILKGYCHLTECFNKESNKCTSECILVKEYRCNPTLVPLLLIENASRCMVLIHLTERNLYILRLSPATPH